MEKNKNRADLLAAGRKKLQQFKKKKESKGSSSHEKSSHKTSNSENEVHADLAPDALKSMASPKADEGETASPLGADAGSVHSSESHSMVNLAAPDTEMSALDPLVPPIAAESSRGDILPDSDAQLAPGDSGEGDAVSVLGADSEHVIDSSVPMLLGVVDDGESIQTIHDEVGHVNYSETSAMTMVVEPEFEHDNAAVEDADCSGSKQCDGSTNESHGFLQDGDSLEVGLVNAELERDEGLVLSEHVESAENFQGATPEGRGTKEAIHEANESVRWMVFLYLLGQSTR
ncbi:hypothetical protein HHK36_032616 [Tetracentron sinense]|uniref:Uncharacterized protein n=1 Tax=Tetracentron sinense TaxID=13715 RepID=A0A835CXI5_TETSI|nr:hypothetical protein HHK36_032616 [Tetracentron sinense]